MRAVSLICIVMLFLSCSPKVIVIKDSSSAAPKKMISPEFVDILKPQTSFDIESPSLGELEIKDGGFSVKCGYEQVMQIAKEEASALGGNIVVVTEETPKGIKSTCHQIKGSVYYLDEPEQYKSTVDWLADRPLRIEDFRGSTEDRPASAATYSGFSYRYEGLAFSKYFRVDFSVYFDKKLSYFKRSELDTYVLRHEHVHFDLTELYARRFIRSAKDNFTSYENWLSGHERLFTEIQHELALEQDKYDSEVYRDSSLQAGWTEKVKNALEALSDYEGLRSIEILKR